MTERKFIVKGDRTTHGGTVVTAWGESGPVPHTIDGIPVACVGDKATCPRHPGLHTIIEGATNSTLAGKQMTLEGCLVDCGARLVSVQQSRCTHDNDPGGPTALEAAVARSAAERAAAAGAGAKTTSTWDRLVTPESAEPREPICEGCLKKAAQEGSFFLAI